MSRTKRSDGKGNKTIADKSRRKHKDKKFFGFTSGTHSEFEKTKEIIKKEFEETPIDSPWYAIRKKRWDKIKNKTYTVKGEDYVKYGYGQRKKK